MTTTTTVQQTAPPATSSTRRVRGFTVATAVLSTSLLYLAAKALGTDFALTDPGKAEPHALILPEIAVFALVFSLLGLGTLALLERFTRRPKVIWTVLATAVLLLSFVPIGIEHATTDTKIMLSVIHLAVAAALTPVLRRTHRETTQSPTS
ncbi:MAG: hypothetical protein QOE54_6601 [Streptosporangiaceae bacterium]|jgi:cell division protein FtsL|nr:hypothetical protein [Streptosporangiaceae bacterium]MDX6434235.1 hypothetical protein [Streptosporangiaceae bacterium]